MIALIFLVTMSLFTISSMRSSNMGLFLAQNEESRVAAEQIAQALADAIVASPASTPVVGLSGYTACTAGETGCNTNDLPVTDPTLAAKYQIVVMFMLAFANTVAAVIVGALIARRFFTPAWQLRAELLVGPES